MKVLHGRFIIRLFLTGVVKIALKLSPATYSMSPPHRSRDHYKYHDDQTQLTKLIDAKNNYKNVELWYSKLSRKQSIQRANILPIFLAALSAPPRRVYKLLDVGGGLGQTDLALLACNKLEIDMTIFELDPIVKVGKLLQKNNVKYVSNFPTKKFDIVHLGSSLQYFYNFKGLIRQIIDTEPTYIVIVDTTVSQLPTFEAFQLNLPFTKILRWIFNIDDLNELMHGYTLIHQSYNYAPQHKFKSSRAQNVNLFHGNFIYMRLQSR